MVLAGWVALAVAGVAVALVVRGWDVRLVLLGASLVVAAVADLSAGTFTGSPPAVTAVLREFLATFSNEKFVIPICTAMGFAYVLRHTGCERHLVLVLVRPLRHVRWLLVPGVVVVGFLVNIPVISQTSTAVCIGPVVIPLMRAAGYSLATAGACLLLGASVGGELLNPGAPELLTVYAKTGVPTVVQTGEYLPRLVFTQLAVSVVVLWAMTVWWERAGQNLTPQPPSPRGNGEPDQNDPSLSLPSLRGKGEPDQNDPSLSPPSLLGKGAGGLGSSPATPERINLLKALVPLVPLALLFASGVPEEYRLLDVPDAWVAPLKDGKRDSAYSTRLIGLAMLVGVVAAMAVTPGKARGCVKEFFDGAGYGFANIISLIVTATCFGKAVESAGLATALGRLTAAYPDLLHPLAALVPLGFAQLCGSGMASTQSLYGFFHDPAASAEANTAVGALVALGSAAGRTMSPVAAVVLMCGTLTGTNPFTLAKRVAVPLLAGIAVVIALRMCGVL